LQERPFRILELLHPDNHHPQLAPDLLLRDAHILPQPVGLDHADDQQIDEEGKGSNLPLSILPFRSCILFVENIFSQSFPAA
jgi:hypothetical protein